MPYYDRIARQWHRATGVRGGALKALALNDRLLDRIEGISGKRILEIGAGTGYFLPLVRRRYSGQEPARLVITDVSPTLLELAQREFRIDGADYRVMDARAPYPFADGDFDLVLGSMVFNELATAGLRRALAECGRVLWPGGQLLAAVTHPAFVASLARRGELRPAPGGGKTMPGAAGLRLPVVERSEAEYRGLFHAAGFAAELEPVAATPALLKAKPGLRAAGAVPLALVIDARRR